MIFCMMTSFLFASLFVLSILFGGRAAVEYDICLSSFNNLNITGVVHLGNYLWIIVEHPSTYIVYEFSDHSETDVVVNGSAAHRVGPLQAIWPTMSPKIAPKGRSIVSVAGLSENLYERSSDSGEAIAHRSSGDHAAVGGILFVFNDERADILDLATEAVIPLSSEWPRQRMSLLLSPLSGEGVLLSKVDGTTWHYHTASFKSGLIWPSSPRFLLSEVATPEPLNEWDRDHRFYLFLIFGQYGLNEAAEERLALKWKWATGYEDGEVLHIFTDEGVYLLERPESQMPYLVAMTAKHNASEWIPLNAFKLSYGEYFLCNASNASEHFWNALYRAVIFAKPQQVDQSKTRGTVIYVLFALHFFVALVMIAIIVLMQVRPSSLASKPFTGGAARSNKSSSVVVVSEDDDSLDDDDNNSNNKESSAAVSKFSLKKAKSKSKTHRSGKNQSSVLSSKI